MHAIVWVVALLLTGLVTMVLEVFVPSGGILGFVSVAALVAGVATAFYEGGAILGTLVLCGMSLVVPAVIVLAFRLFPLTPLGRRVLPPPPRPEDVVPAAGKRQLLRGLVGKTGRTVDELLPWGGVEVDGLRVDAVSVGGPIPRGVTVEVVGVQGPALVVRVGKVVEAAAAPETAAVPEAPALSTTLESFDFDQLGRQPLDSPPDPDQS